MTKRSKVSICVILHGLPRSFGWIERSLVRNVLEPFRRVCDAMTIVAHFNIPDRIDNPRSRELCVAMDYPDLSRLRPDMLMVERQCEGTILEKLDRLKTHDLLADDDTLRSHANLLQGYYSLTKAWDLAIAAGLSERNVVLLLRPDMDYLEPWPAEDLIAMIVDQGADLVTPNWHKFEGLNDRIAVASFAGARTYTARWHRVELIVEEGVPRRSEQILARCAEIDGLKLATFRSHALRVRGDGRTQFDEYGYSLSYRVRCRLRYEMVRTGVRPLRSLARYLY